MHEQLALGAEREAKTRQEHAQYEEAVLERIRVERKILENNIKRKTTEAADEAAGKDFRSEASLPEFTHKGEPEEKVSGGSRKGEVCSAV